MTQKNYNVVVARRADNMILSHTKFLAQVSPSSARRLLTGFKKMIGSLSNNPLQFPFADELDVPGIITYRYRKCLFEKRYKILFLIEDNNVYVDAIIDCRQENKNLY